MDRDVAALRTTREEARNALDHQIATLNDVDAKAASTLRFALGFTGLLLTGLSTVGFAAIERLATDGDSLAAVVQLAGLAALASAVAGFLVAVFYAIETYTATRFRAGLGGADVDRILAEGYTEEELLYLLNESYADWIGDARERNAHDTALLDRSHRSLQAGVGLSALGVVLFALGTVL